jgi:polysaccharide pyruvyl transferase CsaB
VSTRRPDGVASIVILSGDADANLGDRAILQAMVEEIHRLRPNARITSVSARTDAAAPGLATIRPGPRGFPALCRALAASDLVLCGGGGLFQDDDSLVKMPYWCMRVALARWLAPRVVGYSLGVGPLQSRSSRLAARLAFRAMASISVRDPLAQQIAQRLTTKPVAVVPDPALLLRPVGEYGKVLIGVAVRRWFPPQPRLVPNVLRRRLWPRTPALGPGSQQLARLLGQALDELVRAHDAHVLLMPSYGASHEGDVAMCREVMTHLPTQAAHLLEVDDPALYKAIAARVQLFIGGRMHPTIFAASAGTRVVGLAYNPKFHGFFSMLGLERQVLDVVDFVHGAKVDQLVRLASSVLLGPVVSRDAVERLADTVRSHDTALLESLP